MTDPVDNIARQTGRAIAATKQLQDLLEELDPESPIEAWRLLGITMGLILRGYECPPAARLAFADASTQAMAFLLALGPGEDRSEEVFHAAFDKSRKVTLG